MRRLWDRDTYHVSRYTGHDTYRDTYRDTYVAIQYAYRRTKYRDASMHRYEPSKERNLHCDIVPVTTKWVSRLVLDHAIAAIQTSR